MSKKEEITLTLNYDDMQVLDDVLTEYLYNYEYTSGDIGSLVYKRANEAKRIFHGIHELLESKK
jgi:hypothetical protein